MTLPSFTCLGNETADCYYDDTLINGRSVGILMEYTVEHLHVFRVSKMKTVKNAFPKILSFRNVEH